MTKREELANLICLEDLRTRQLVAIRERILFALVGATTEDVESVGRRHPNDSKQRAR